MSNILGRLYYIITGDTSSLDRNLDSSRKKMQALGVQLNETGRSILAFAKGTITAVLIKSLTEAASRAEEMQNRFDTVFRGIESETQAWAEAYAEATSRGVTETMEFLSQQQDIRTGFGDTRESAAEFSKAVVGITNDLASFANIPVAEAIAAVNSGLNGEFEALRRLGVGLNVAILNQMEYAESIGKTWDEMDNLERQEAILSGIVSQSANALHQNITAWQEYDYTLGDAAVTSGSFANQMQGFMQTLTDFRAELGENLLPVATKAVSSVTGLMRAFNGLDDAAQSVMVSIAAAGAAWFAIGGPLGAVAGAAAGLAIGLSNIRPASERLRDSMDDLSEATLAYSEATRKLSDDTGTLTEKQRTLLQAEQELAKSKAQSKLGDVASSYRDTTKAIAAAYDEYIYKKAQYDAAVISRDSTIEEMDREIMRLVRRGTENLTAYESALLENLNFLVNGDRTRDFLNGYVITTEKAMEDAKTAWIEEGQVAEESLHQLAVYLNQGILDLSDYESVYPELCEEIRTTAAELGAMKEATDAAAESAVKAASAARDWRDALREQNAELLEEGGSYREAYSLRVRMLEDEKEAALRKLAVDAQVIESGESVTDLSIEELRKRLSANKETNAELLAMDQYYANESVRLWEEMWRNTHESSSISAGADSYESMLQRQQAAMKNAAAAEMERNGQYAEALEIRKALIEEERDAAVKAAEERIQAGISSAEELLSINAYYDQEIISAEEESAAREIEAQKRKAEEIKAINREMFSSILSFASSFSSAIGDVYSSITERRLQAIDEETDAALEALGLQEDTETEKLRKEYEEAVKNGDMELAAEKERELQRQQIEEEAEERKKKLQMEQAKREKAIALFQATISTLSSVIGYMADPGGWAGIAMSAMAAATGAAQIAAIAAEPLPSYAVGAVDISDDQIAQLHQGELVVPKTFAEGIRDGDISIGGADSRVDVTIINYTGAKASVSRSSEADTEKLRIVIGDAISSEIARGRFDAPLTQRYQITRRNPRG